MPGDTCSTWYENTLAPTTSRGTHFNLLARVLDKLVVGICSWLNHAATPSLVRSHRIDKALVCTIRLILQDTIFCCETSTVLLLSMDCARLGSLVIELLLLGGVLRHLRQIQLWNLLHRHRIRLYWASLCCLLVFWCTHLTFWWELWHKLALRWRRILVLLRRSIIWILGLNRLRHDEFGASWPATLAPCVCRVFRADNSSLTLMKRVVAERGAAARYAFIHSGNFWVIRTWTFVYLVFVV